MKASFYLKLGETVFLRFSDRARLDTLALITSLQFNRDETVVTLKTYPKELITKVATPYVDRRQDGIAFDPITRRVYFGTRWDNVIAYMETAPSGEIIGEATRISLVTLLDWETGYAIQGENLYIKDTRERAILSGNPPDTYISIGIYNLTTDASEIQYLDNTNRVNKTVVVDDDENIYIGEVLGTQNILRRVIPVDNPSLSNQMTVPGDYIVLERSIFSRSLGKPVTINIDRALTWYDGHIYGIDPDSKVIIKYEIEDIPGSLNKRASIVDDLVQLPDDIEYIGDITRGRAGTWYIIGSDGTVDTDTGFQVLWLWTIFNS